MSTQAQIDAVVNEGGEGYSQAAVNADNARRAREAASQAAFEIEQAAANAAFLSVWTLDVLAVRRAAWNSEMQALSARGAKMTRDVFAATSKKLGFRMDDIQRAKALRGIQ